MTQGPNRCSDTKESTLSGFGRMLAWCSNVQHAAMLFSAVAALKDGAAPSTPIPPSPGQNFQNCLEEIPSSRAMATTKIFAQRFGGASEVLEVPSDLLLSDLEHALQSVSTPNLLWLLGPLKCNASRTTKTTVPE